MVSKLSRWVYNAIGSIQFDLHRHLTKSCFSYLQLPIKQLWVLNIEYKDYGLSGFWCKTTHLQPTKQFKVEQKISEKLFTTRKKLLQFWTTEKWWKTSTEWRKISETRKGFELDEKPTTPFFCFIFVSDKKYNKEKSWGKKRVPELLFVKKAPISKRRVQ